MSQKTVDILLHPELANRTTEPAEVLSNQSVSHCPARSSARISILCWIVHEVLKFFAREFCPIVFLMISYSPIVS